MMVEGREPSGPVVDWVVRVAGAEGEGWEGEDVGKGRRWTTGGREGRAERMEGVAGEGREVSVRLEDYAGAGLL